MQHSRTVKRHRGLLPSTQADGGHFKVPGRAQQLVLLYVYNAVLLRLAPALGSPKLPELRLQLLAAECPRMR